MNSALAAEHHVGLLKTTLPKVGASVTSMIFSNFEKVFGSGTSSSLEIRSLSVPVLNITHSQTVIEGNCTLHIKNPFNEEYDAAIISSHLRMELIMEIHEKFNMTGKVEKIEFEVYGYETFFEQDTDLTTV